MWLIRVCRSASVLNRGASLTKSLTMAGDSEWTEGKLRRTLLPYNDVTYRWDNLGKWPGMEQCRQAAILIPLFIKDGQIYVWLTERSENVTHDRGHVSFPGGMKDDCDNTAVDTCLREAEEEVGLKREQVEIVIELLPRINSRGNLISPLVGIVSPHFVPEPNSEVELAFALPLTRFLSKERYRSHRYEMKGQVGTIHFFTDVVNNRDVVTWGLTATVCLELAVALYQRDTEFSFAGGDLVTPEDPFRNHRKYMEDYRQRIMKTVSRFDAKSHL